MTFADVVREYFPNATDDQVDYILFEYTGFPCFWNIPEDGHTPETCVRKQLQCLKDSDEGSAMACKILDDNVSS